MSTPSPRVSLTAAAALTAVAAVAPTTTPTLLWVLLPAAALLGVGLLGRPAFAAAGLPRHAATAVVAALGALATLTAIGAVATGATGLEPTWVASATGAAGYAMVAATAWLGLAIAVADGPRPAGLLLAAALPIGLGFDAVVATAIPVGFFVQGVSIAFVLLAVALLRLGRADAPST